MHRDRLGVSQDRLAREINVTSGAIGAWESGRREPSGKFVAALARHFGVPMESFYVHSGNGTDDSLTVREVREFREVQ